VKFAFYVADQTIFVALVIPEQIDIKSQDLAEQGFKNLDFKKLSFDQTLFKSSESKKRYKKEDQSIEIELQDSAVFGRFELAKNETLSQMLIPFLNEFLKPYLLLHESITWIGCARGPQPFTSLRIQWSVFQGFSLCFPKAHLFSPTHFELFNWCYKNLAKTNLKLFLSHKKLSKNTPGEGLFLIPFKKETFYGRLFSENSYVDTVFDFNEVEDLLKKKANLFIFCDHSIVSHLQNKIYKNEVVFDRDFNLNLAFELIKMADHKDDDFVSSITPFIQEPYYLNNPQFKTLK
jgi:tRNA A37 threonylcarbamoyladenosine modification protein TsaB